MLSSLNLAAVVSQVATLIITSLAVLQIQLAAGQNVSIPATTSKPNYLETGRQITGILDRFMSLGYDKRVRPNYGGPPVEVNVTMRILSISSVSEVMMDFTADFYFRQTWHDPRLSFRKLGDIQTLYVGAEVSKKIWLPDTFFGNEKLAYFHEATTPNVFLRIDHSGEVYRSIRLTVSSSCPMNLQYFPMDRQRCTIEAESYGYNVKDIIYRWARKETAVERDKEISLPQFDIVRTVQKYRLEELSSGTYSRLIAEIHFARRMGYYLIQIYIPSSLIVVISWVSFWLHRNASPARVQLGVTTVLTMTTLMSSTNAALPKISYVKSIDIFLGTCFVMVFAALLEYATVGYLGKRIAMRKAQVQHAQSQNQARIMAQLQAQGAQGGDPAAPNAGSNIGIFGTEPITSSTEATTAALQVQAGQPLNLFATNNTASSIPLEPLKQAAIIQKLAAGLETIEQNGCPAHLADTGPNPPSPPPRANRWCACSCQHEWHQQNQVCMSHHQTLHCNDTHQSCNHSRSTKQQQAASHHHNHGHGICQHSTRRANNIANCGCECGSQTLPRNISFANHVDYKQQNCCQPPAYCNQNNTTTTTTTNHRIPSAAATAAAATFINLHRSNKGLPPSSNPNFSQFSWLGSNNRNIETIFGIRPSDIDKYSRVIFPVCFVCFQLMYWIVYLHISAFLESEQQQQQPQ